VKGVDVDEAVEVSPDPRSASELGTLRGEGDPLLGDVGVPSLLPEGRERSLNW
jgi:hypothetical protein